MAGESFPARFPAVADALGAGVLEVDAAGVIVRALGQVTDRVPAGQIGAAEHELVAVAWGSSESAALPVTADELRMQALVWQLFLDPDGVEPAEERAMAKRGLRLGAIRDGLVPISGMLLPEIAARFTGLLHAYMTPRTAPAFLSTEEQSTEEQSTEEQSTEEQSTEEQAAAGGLPVVVDPRRADQQRHDILAGILDIAARSVEVPSIGGAPPTVLVSVTKDDLEAGTGAGRIIELGSPERCFTPAQRRAIMERDGGCIITGCPIPAAWTEIHHVVPARDDGPTHTDNGVCLCWADHRMIEQSGWEIRMINGVPHLKAPPRLRHDNNWHPPCTSRTRLTTTLKHRRE